MRDDQFRIIIIDNNTDIHSDFSNILSDKKLNFEIDTVTQSKKGFEQIVQAYHAGNPYALAFVNIHMQPEWDGIETIKHIWSIDSDIQIVICTDSDYTWEEKIASLGKSDNLLILKKPFDHIAVRQIACALTHRWRLMQEHALLKKKLQHQATHDSLTGLPNRVFLLDKVQSAISSAKLAETHFAVLLFDLDRFKLVNDSLSHEAGNELLQAVTQKIRQMIKPDDIFACLGGDEFVLLMLNLTEEKNKVVTTARNLINKIREPFIIKGHTISISMSIGISIYPKDGQTVSELIKNADSAMYHAKEAGSDQFQFYDDKLNKVIKERFSFELDLRNALRENQFQLFYQPQFNLSENKLVAVEALIRWNHPQRGFLLPIEFIPFAENVGLIIPIGEWVLRHACKQMKAWHDAGYPKIRLAVNINSQQLKQFDIVKTIQTILTEIDLEPKYLELELTENSIINNPNIIEAIDSLKKLGIFIALDDFGSGYSTLNYLRSLSLDRLKIDRSFVQNILINRGDEAIIQAIIDMAKGFNLEVLAEGVENEEQLNFLKERKVGEIQGFYFSKPLDVKSIEKFLKNDIDINELFV